MSEAAPARNELEALLLDFHAGNIAPEEFARRLLDAQVFMPVKDEKHRIAGFQASTQAAPLLEVKSQRSPPALAMART